MKPKTGSTAAPKPSSAAAPKAKPSQSAPDDFLKIRGTDHVEFYVGNAKQAAYYYAHAFGLSAAAYGGLETGLRDRASYVLQQGKVRFVFSSPLGPEGFMAEQIRLHGDGVHDIALEVEVVDRAYKETTKRGARRVQEPDATPSLSWAGRETYARSLDELIETALKLEPLSLHACAASVETMAALKQGLAPKVAICVQVEPSHDQVSPRETSPPGLPPNKTTRLSTKSKASA